MSVSPYIGDITFGQYSQLDHVIDRKSNDDPSLQKAAEHFESLFIDMWLKSAREANRVFSEDNPMQSNELKMHEEMRDHEMSVHLAGNGGIGLAEVIVRQLRGEAPVSTQTQSANPVLMQSATQNAPLLSAPLLSAPRRTTAFSTPAEFVDAIKPVIESVAEGENMPIMGMLSQAALETGWGRRVIADHQGKLSHNLFGVKTQDNSQPHVAINTTEYEASGWTQRPQNFRSYPDWQASIVDYVDKLKGSERYADVVNTGEDVTAFAQSLADAGYATDPQYAEKIVDIYQRLKNLVSG